MRDLPDHHAGIQGVDRADDLLSLEDSALAHRDALTTVAFHLHGAMLVGNPAPKVRGMWERVREPQIGDFVVEVTRGHYSKDPDLRRKAFGVLLATREEYTTTDAQWAELIAEYPEEDERLTDTAWYIQYGSAGRDVCRWTNCRFYMVPITMDVIKL